MHNYENCSVTDKRVFLLFIVENYPKKRLKAAAESAAA